MKIYSIEVFNLNTTGVFCGEPVPKGCLGVVVDKVEHSEYQCLDGDTFYSNCGGIVSVYGYIPGSTEGFAGRKIILPVREQSKVFKNKTGITRKVFNGSLWSSYQANQKVAKHLGTKLFSIGVREAGDRCKVYCAHEATQEFIDRISKVVVIGDAQQSPLI
ncbi:hypothetical protein [Vibrio furnissii]|uniref:hypothetical protein n=1 Tax=Vibrio furnissii TaxID=29494 RepID=UPI001EECB122|nr:hypothetical protein [Vibrio furnissii]